MKKFLEKIPLPLCGVFLAIASMGNLVAPYGLGFKYACGVLSAIIAALLLLKTVFDTKSIVSGLEHPVLSGVLGTFSMGLMVFATYIAPFAGIVGYAVWFTGLAIHLLVMLSYSARFIAKPSLSNLYPSSFIPFVGLAMVSATAPGFGMNDLGIFFCWFSLIAYLVVLPVVLFRVIRIRNLNPQTMPLLGIFAAPASLCLLGYLSLYREINVPFTMALAALAFASTVAVIFCLPAIIKREFYPSYAALGFPFVGSAGAMTKLASVMSDKQASIAAVIGAIAFVERFIALAILSYILARYLSFLFTDPVRATKGNS